jgi:uncharacterized iron-regulated membrane protein
MWVFYGLLQVLLVAVGLLLVLPRSKRWFGEVARLRTEHRGRTLV